ncbi:MAG: ATP synthase F1 subunit delta [Bacteroidales bacterium]|jgi:F-type H+-transporting ATPase subunit delta|nr:ATP synthase F1 subunit delta [Bacteroidales bacterium]
MKEAIVARRYASALFEVASENQKVNEVYSDIRQIYNLCQKSRDFSLMLKNPVVPAPQKRKIMKVLFDGKIEDISLRFFLILASKGREDITEEICNQFVIIYKEANNIHDITIRTASPLSKENREEILNQLNTVINGTIELEEIIEPALIGGYQLLYDDKRYDASVRKQISELRRKFTENLFVKQF